MQSQIRTKPRRALSVAAEQFVAALDDALYDKRQEQTSRVIYLFDADLVVDAILGLTSWEPSQAVPEVSSLKYIVRALFSVGYLPTAHLLRPHLVELERFVHFVPAPSGLEGGIRARHLRLLARQWELDQHDKRVKEYAKDLKALESVIRTEGFEIFVKLELCYGGLAYDRLLRILPHCVFRSNELATYPVRPRDPFAAEMSEVILQQRRAHKTINSLVDGYALSELAQHIAAGASVRFYTETSALHSAGNDPRLREPTGRKVFRDAEYMLMRCSFPALSFSHLKQGPNISNSPFEWSFEDLVSLKGQLQELLSGGNTTDPQQLERAIRSEQVGASDLTLAELIEDFYELKFLRSVFLGRWRVPEPMAKFVPYLANFFSSPSRVAGMREALGHSFTATTKALKEEISQLIRWQADVNLFRRTVEVRRKEFDGAEPDPWRDLGLGRWGLDVLLPEAVRHDLSQWLRDVADENVPVERIASDLALQMVPDGYRSSDEFALAQCQLWCLKMYERLVVEWRENHLRVLADDLHVLRIPYLVAQVKTLAAGFKDQKAREVQRVLARVAEAEKELSQFQTLGDERLPGISKMGVAHVAYWAWQRLRELDDQIQARSMAEKSFEAAKDAQGQFVTRSLAWAFAINHCVYVGTVSGVRKPETEMMRSQLLHVNARHYHYRFADTEARQYTEEVRETIEKWGVVAITSEKHLRSTRTELCKLTNEAQKVLAASRPFFGDEEVERHWRELQGYMSSLKCRDRLGKGSAPKPRKRSTPS